MWSWSSSSGWVLEQAGQDYLAACSRAICIRAIGSCEQKFGPDRARPSRLVRRRRCVNGHRSGTDYAQVVEAIGETSAPIRDLNLRPSQSWSASCGGHLQTTPKAAGHIIWCEAPPG